MTEMLESLVLTNLFYIAYDVLRFVRFLHILYIYYIVGKRTRKELIEWPISIS